MRALIQRVSRSHVDVKDSDGTVRRTGQVARGFVVLVGFAHADTPQQSEWMAEKIAGLRVFEDGDGKMNLALADVGGSVLVVSQFTLYGDASKGRRPSFIDAARPETAVPLYEGFLGMLRSRGLTVETGEFGASMEVEIVNDGPVTLWLER